MMSSPAAVAARLRPCAVLRGLAALAAGCSSSSPVTNFDLTRAAAGAGRKFGASDRSSWPSRGPCSRSKPTGSSSRTPTGAVSYLGGGQWADRLPRLIQSRLIQTFENSHGFRAVSRPGRCASRPDFQLTTEIRAFQIDAATGAGGGRDLRQARQRPHRPHRDDADLHRRACRSARSMPPTPRRRSTGRCRSCSSRSSALSPPGAWPKPRRPEAGAARLRWLGLQP